MFGLALMIMGLLLAEFTSPTPAFAQTKPEPSTPQRFERTELRMGSPARVVLYAPNDDVAESAFDAAFARLQEFNSIFSDYDAESETMRLCRASPAGQPRAVSADLLDVLQKSQQLSEESQGAFDVTVGPLTKLWRRARRQRQLPSAALLDDAKAASGYRKISIDAEARTVALARTGMQLDFGGIAKGAAAEAALTAVQRLGVSSALVGVAGDIAVSEPPPGQAGWKIGIAPLAASDGPPSRFVSLVRQSISTSGDAHQFVEIDGTRYSHIVDPRTGIGLTRSASVTVIAPHGWEADGLATALSVLGPAAGLPLIERREAAAALFVLATETEPEVVASKRFEQWVIPAPK